MKKLEINHLYEITHKNSIGSWLIFVVSELLYAHIEIQDSDKSWRRCNAMDGHISSIIGDDSWEIVDHGLVSNEDIIKFEFWFDKVLRP